jgi:hypothetical protein
MLRIAVGSQGAVIRDLRTPTITGFESRTTTIAGVRLHYRIGGKRTGKPRIPPKSLALFETVVNIVHEAAPKVSIAFNTRPEDTAEAAARQVKAA